MDNQLLDREEKLLEIIKMQKEAIDFYADKNNWRTSSLIKEVNEIIFREDLENFDQLTYNTGISSWKKLSIGGKRARATQKAVEEKLKELGD